MPHYASCVCIELYRSKDGNNYKVEVLYWPELKGPDKITSSITGCEKGCSLNDFVQRSQKYKIEDEDKVSKISIMHNYNFSTVNAIKMMETGLRRLHCSLFLLRWSSTLFFLYKKFIIIKTNFMISNKVRLSSLFSMLKHR